VHQLDYGLQTVGMKHPRVGAAMLAIGVMLTACSASHQPPSSESSVSATTEPTTLAHSCTVASQSPPAQTIAAKFPTALAFAPDGRLFYAERSGTVRVFQNGRSRVFATVRTVTTEPGGGYSERGLLGLTVSPTFASDRYVYAFYSNTDRVRQDVIRWTDCAGVGTNPRIILQLPAGPDCCHKGGRLVFGPDGKLYITLGEEHDAPAAQDTADVRGKILRYNPDGSVPADNPFGPSDPVWAFGLRNPFGVAFSASGQMALTVNGPTGDAGSPSSGYDTVILAVARGGGYGWPNCYGYSHLLPPATTCGTGQLGPDWSSETSTVVPTGAAFVDSSGPVGYAGHLVFCSFNSGMQIVTPGGPHATVTSGPSECRLDVKEAPNHALYYSDTGHIYRLS
jgi:aldose sugar dehydrogenase